MTYPLVIWYVYFNELPQLGVLRPIKSMRPGLMMKPHITICPVGLFTGKHEENILIYILMRDTSTFID